MSCLELTIMTVCHIMIMCSGVCNRISTQKGVGLMKKLSRILSCLLVLVIMCSVLAIPASAYEVSSGSTSSGKRTYYIYHTWGNSATLSLKTAGTGHHVLGGTITTSGKFTVKVTTPDGKTTSRTWYPDSNKSISLFNRLSKTGRYTIEVSGVAMTNKYQDRWITYPNYKIVYK